ncbi:hypothetical protein C8Q74DRAFT_1372902 [Fomes fomentarius]|nr:hypothetical protein C8Q74DRAFT_1372902 [Fomes fomentarius]
MALQNASSSDLQLSTAELLQILYKTTGALFLAAFFNTMLYSLMLHQAYRYFRQYTKDAMIIKLIVSFVIVVETAYTTLHASDYVFVMHYATMELFVHIIWSGNIMFHIIQFTFAMIITVKGFVHANPSVYTDQKWMFGVTFGFVLLANFSISGALFGVMCKGRKTYKWNSLKSTVDQITIYIVNTSTLVFLLDMTALILVQSPPHYPGCALSSIVSCKNVPQAEATDGNLYWAALNSIIMRVFTNTLFCMQVSSSLIAYYQPTLITSYHICRLNSRKLHAAHSIEIFSDRPLHTISHANRLAAIERWNIPKVIDPTPPTINIAVATKHEDKNMSRITSQEFSQH